MYNQIIRNIFKNIVGFSTKRKILVIESDDWGSIRTKDKYAYDTMLGAGLDVDKNPFTMFDALESNDDLSRLYEVLTKYKDGNGRNPVFTPMYIMANPNFEAIKSNRFTKYEFEHFFETSKKYPNHDQIELLIEQGINAKIFMPELHGREHINAPRWMRLLQKEDKVAIISFNNYSFGAMAFNGIITDPYLNTFAAEFPEEINYVQENLTDAVKMFKETFGYAPSHFIEPNEYGPIEIEKILHDLEIQYILRAKFTKYSNYHNTFTKNHFHWLGKQNKWKQTYITRNCTFEPLRPLDLDDVVASCLSEIENSFFWGKPAIISSHRASYVGSISEDNQLNGLHQLDCLLKNIVKKWPEVEFMSSTELGNYIKSTS
jgi:hypothetical protein